MAHHEKRPPELSSAQAEPGLSTEESLLLTTPLPHDLPPDQMERLWEQYQHVIGRLLVRMGTENKMFEPIMRVPLVGTLDAVYARLALIPKLGYQALHVLGKHGLNELI